MPVALAYEWVYADSVYICRFIHYMPSSGLSTTFAKMPKRIRIAVLSVCFKIVLKFK